jgi:hypothetical protein
MMPAVSCHPEAAQVDRFEIVEVGCWRAMIFEEILTWRVLQADRE